MAKPTTRVLALLEALQSQGRVGGAEMARRLGVHPRTLRRYIVALEELGIPITTERGRHGAYMLVAGFKLPPMMFTDDEALALSVGLLAARNLGLAGAAAAIASAQAKLERVMPAKLRRHVRAIDETVTLELSRAAPVTDNATLAVIAEATQARRRVCLAYRSGKGEHSERAFDPYGLLLRDGQWYAAGMCHLRGGLRSFRLDRVTGVRVLDAGFERPPDFDVARNLSQSIARIPRRYAITVLLRCDLATALEHLRETIGLFEPCKDGVVLRGSIDNPDWFARLLAQLPFGFEVRRSVALRGALRRHAGRILKSAARPAA
ncbi:MAG TPA: YafY family protein [Rhodanobacteraceae bacterium]|nr:YafY family protein [Rhodanobacteraceae bacterium]